MKITSRPVLTKFSYDLNEIYWRVGWKEVEVCLLYILISTLQASSITQCGPFWQQGRHQVEEGGIISATYCYTQPSTLFKESTMKNHPKCHPEWSSGRALVPDDSWYDLARMFLTIFKGGGSRILQVWYKKEQRVSITTEPARWVKEVLVSPAVHPGVWQRSKSKKVTRLPVYQCKMLVLPRIIVGLEVRRYGQKQIITTLIF